MKRKDIAWFSNFWSNEKDFVFAFDGQLHTDYQQWFNGYYNQGLSGMKELLDFRFSNGRGSVLSDNVVSYATNFDWTIITTAGDTVRSKGFALYVFKRRDDGKWAVVNSAGTHAYY